MTSGFRGWSEVAEHLRVLSNSTVMELNDGQRASLAAIASRLMHNGVIIADEVGMGKTRIAAAVAKSVIDAGGRVAILVPPGLGYQWGDELRLAAIETPRILRSLWQFLQAWESEERPSPWFNERAVLISHAFTNWRLGATSAAWRWALLPELYARWKKRAGGRFPNFYHDNELLGDAWVRRAAKSIIGAVSDSSDCHPSRYLIQELVAETPWPGALDAGEYGRNAQLRPWLERAVGLGLGVYDLVITDEAHKSRGQDSGLNRLLEHVVLHSADARRLAMTATPVELDADQWKQILGRIKADGISASGAISIYAEAVRNVRHCPSDEKARAAYKVAAIAFKEALKPYLLRRDKREDPSVLEFQAYSGEGFHAYRREREVLVDTGSLSDAWKQAVCAAEALSFVTQRTDDSIAKRLRLTLGNGHGIAALIDQIHRHERDDKKQSEVDGTSLRPELGDSPEILLRDKRLQRAEWWQKVLIHSSKDSASGDIVLYDHPALLATVEAIEVVCKRDEKVLVFGRFTRPLRALVDLLNARAMLRSLDAGHPWPQSKVHENEWGAISAAHRQLQRSGSLIRSDLDRMLDQQYGLLEQQRRVIRERLTAYIGAGLEKLPASSRVRALFGAFEKKVAKSVRQEDQGNEHSLAVVARAIQELVGSSEEFPSADEFAIAFADLVEAASDRDEGDANGDGELDKDEAADLWDALEARLRDEYSRTEGGFARLMYGETKPESRRLLQLAFNRKHGHPKVLVAQSLVGREGLNLHKACRTVILLHPEWNPGVVEQQIGRVDRIGSLWESKLKDVIAQSKPKEEIPRIEICPVIFRGTYDEMNWQVLRERWDDLRAQLHGIVISPRIADRYVDAGAMVAEINNAAPCFSPTKS